jgi:hypothetical protein
MSKLLVYDKFVVQIAILNQLGWKSHLVFNAVLTGVAMTGLIYEKHYNYQV